MHVLTRMARPADKEVPMSYFDFMTTDSVSMLYCCSSFSHAFSCFKFISLFLFRFLHPVFLLRSCFFAFNASLGDRKGIQCIKILVVGILMVRI